MMYLNFRQIFSSVLINKQKRSLGLLLSLSLLGACSSSDTGTLLGSNNNTNSNIALTISGSGQVSSNPTGLNCEQSCNQSFSNQNQVTLNANAAPGWVLSHWLGACEHSNSSCTIATDNNNTIAISAVFSQLNNTLSVDSFSLINSDTDQAINGFDPLINNSVINLNQLASSNINLRANTSGNVQSVKFGLDENANFRDENIAPFAFNNEVAANYQDWGLALGEHTISAAAFDQSNAQGSSSPSFSRSFTIVAVKWQALSASINFDAAINTFAPNAKTIIIRNTGNISGTLSLQSNLPSWINLANSSVELEANASSNLEISVNACQSVGTDNSNLIFGGENAATVSIAVQRNCVVVPDNDFSLNRFYINQSVPAQDSQQSASQRTPLVANRAGLARAFVSATNPNNQSPNVVLNYRYSNGNTGSLVLSGPDAVPTNPLESQLSNTFNVDLNANLIQAGMQIYIEVDPDNQILEANETNNRYPSSGYLSLDIDQVPSLNIVIVPIRVNNGATPSISMSEAQTLLSASQRLHPVSQMNISFRSPISYNGSSWENMLMQLRETHLADSNTAGKLYHGIIETSPDNSNTAGIGYLGWPVAISLPYQGTIAHEIGHNFDLPHAPCGGPDDADVNYPYFNAQIGVYGYDIVNKELKLPSRKDVMSYCDPIWISDYNYKKVLSFRQSSFGYAQSSSQAPSFADVSSNEPQATLLVSGKIDNEQASFNRVLQLNTQARSTPTGPYRLVAYDSDNESLFSLPFDTIKLDHSQSQHFSLAVPLEALDEQKIHRLAIYQGERLLTSRSDKNKTSTIGLAKFLQLGFVRQDQSLIFNWDKQRYQEVLLRDQNGQVIAIDSSGSINLDHTQLTPEQAIEVVYSRGITSTSKTLVIPSL